MKLEFKFGYIHVIKWLLIFREQNYAGYKWQLTANAYNKYWKEMPTEDLTQTRAESIINSLRKL